MSEKNNWDEMFDVVIVGSGFAGLAAALEISQTDNSLLIVEKMPRPGGNSVIDAGELSVVNSPQQKSLHIRDSSKLLAQDMLVNGEFQNSPQKVRYVADRANEIYVWTTEELGVKWAAGVSRGGGHSVPRTITTHTGSGAEIYEKMSAKLFQRGIFPRLNCYVQTIYRNEQGAVEGILVRENFRFPDADSGTIRKIGIRKAIILCYGGFSADVGFRMSKNNLLTANYSTTNQPGATGELWRETERIGCLQAHTDWIQCTPWNNTLEDGMGIGWVFSEYAAADFGMWVNQNGNRFVNECANRKIRSEAIFEQHQKGLKTICLSNASGNRALEKQRPGYMENTLRQGLLKQYATLSEVERDWSIPDGNLSGEVSRFNQLIRNRGADEFGRNLRGLKPLVKGPWFASEMSPKVHYCMGGLVTDMLGRVLDAKTQLPISGLYAAGKCASGVHGVCRMGSCAILDCLVMGRTVGVHSVAG